MARSCFVLIWNKNPVRLALAAIFSQSAGLAATQR
jgi:hypothetical protein